MQLTDSHNISSLTSYAHTKLNTQVLPWLGQSSMYENVDELWFMMHHSTNTLLSNGMTFPTFQNGIRNIRMATGLQSSHDTVATTNDKFQKQCEEFKMDPNRLLSEALFDYTKFSEGDNANDPFNQLKLYNIATAKMREEVEKNNFEKAKEAREQKKINYWMDETHKLSEKANQRIHDEGYSGSWMMRYKHGQTQPLKADLRSTLKPDAVATFNTNIINERMLRKQYYEFPKRIEVLKQWQQMDKTVHPGSGAHLYASKEDKANYAEMEAYMQRILYPYGTADDASTFDSIKLSKTDRNALQITEENNSTIYNALRMQQIQSVVHENGNADVFAQMKNYVVIMNHHASCLKLYDIYQAKEAKLPGRIGKRQLPKEIGANAFRKLM
jgi:hypothetical protein